jgi:hypothetical protein
MAAEMRAAAIMRLALGGHGAVVTRSENRTRDFWTGCHFSPTRDREAGSPSRNQWTFNMKLVSLSALVGLFCLGLTACATQKPQPAYGVGNPPPPHYDAKTELEQGQYMKKRH